MKSGIVFLFAYIGLSTQENILKFYKIEDGKEQVINYQLNGSECFKLPDKNIKYADTNACVLGFPKGEGCKGDSFLIKNRFEIKAFRDWNDWSFRKCIPESEHEAVHVKYEIDGMKKEFFAHNGCNLLLYEIRHAETILADKCIIMFNYYECGGERGFTPLFLIIQPGELVTLAYKRLGLIALHPCDNHPAGPKPNILFYADYRNPANITYSYNVSQETGCVEIDKRWVESYEDSWTEPIYFTNGNCIQLFYDVACTDHRNTLRDGMTLDQWNARWLYDFVNNEIITDEAKVPRSFTTCKAIFVASILNIEVKLNGSEIDSSKFIAHKFGKKEIIYNNGSAILSKYYASKEIMTETTRINIIESITDFGCKSDCLKLEKPSYRDYAAIELHAMIETAYKELFAKRNTAANYSETSVTKSQNKDIYISENVDVPPCTKYELQSIIMFVTDLPTSYVVRVKLSGTFDQERMSVNKLKRFIPKDLEFKKELDNKTIEVVGKGMAFRSFATTHLLNGNGSPIYGCCVKNTGKCK